MNTSSDAAEQVIRITTELGVTAIKLAGTGAKELAALLMAALKPKPGQLPKLSIGKQRAVHFLAQCRQDGARIEDFTINAKDQRAFQKLAKQRILPYAAIADKDREKIHIYVREDDIGRLNKCLQTLGYAEVKFDPESAITVSEADPAILERDASTPDLETSKKNEQTDQPSGREFTRRKTGSNEWKPPTEPQMISDIDTILSAPVVDVKVFDVPALPPAPERLRLPAPEGYIPPGADPPEVIAAYGKIQEAMSNQDFVEKAKRPTVRERIAAIKTDLEAQRVAAALERGLKRTPKPKTR